MGILANFWVAGNLPQPGKRFWLKRILLSAGLIAAVLILFYLEENYRHIRAWQSYAAATGLREKPLDWRDHRLTPVPDNQNFAKTPLLRAIGLKGETDARVLSRFTVFPVGNFTADAFKGTPTDLAGLARALDGAQLSGTNVGKPPAIVVLEALAAIEPELSELRSASRLPCAQFDARGQDPWDLTIPNFVALRSLAQILSVHAGAVLQEGQSAKAAEDIKVILRLSDALKSHNTLVAAMIRVALVGTALGPIREGCVSAAWSGIELTELQELLHDQDLISSLSTSIQGGERAGVHHMAENYGPEEWCKLFAGNKPPSRFSLLAAWLAPRGWRYRALMLYDEPMREFLLAVDPAAQRIDPHRVQTAFDMVERAVNQRPCGMLAAVAIPNFQRALVTTGHTQTMVNMATLVCALGRYKAEHGGLPPTLDEIATALAGRKLPHDLVTGKPIHYALANSGHFTLYTSGYDGKDDAGGIESNPADGDWCWVN
jgi:hypothetical protein